MADLNQAAAIGVEIEKLVGLSGTRTKVNVSY